MRNRSTVELMVLTLTAVVCFFIVLASVLVAYIEIRDPDADTDTIVQSIVSIISGILGALLGLLAGRAARTDELSRRANGRPDSFPPQ